MMHRYSPNSRLSPLLDLPYQQQVHQPQTPLQLADPGSPPTSASPFAWAPPPLQPYGDGGQPSSSHPSPHLPSPYANNGHHHQQQLHQQYDQNGNGSVPSPHLHLGQQVSYPSYERHPSPSVSSYAPAYQSHSHSPSHLSTHQPYPIHHQHHQSRSPSYPSYPPLHPEHPPHQSHPPENYYPPLHQPSAQRAHDSPSQYYPRHPSPLQSHQLAIGENDQNNPDVVRPGEHSLSAHLRQSLPPAPVAGPSSSPSTSTFAPVLVVVPATAPPTRQNPRRASRSDLKRPASPSHASEEKERPAEGTGPGGKSDKGKGKARMSDHSETDREAGSTPNRSDTKKANVAHSPAEDEEEAPADDGEEKPFRCEQCNQSFNRNHDLKRHRRTHLEMKPFKCQRCNKAFSRKDALKRHWLVKGCRGEEEPGAGIPTSEIDDSSHTPLSRGRGKNNKVPGASALGKKLLSSSEKKGAKEKRAREDDGDDEDSAKRKGRVKAVESSGSEEDEEECRTWEYKGEESPLQPSNGSTPHYPTHPDHQSQPNGLASYTYPSAPPPMNYPPPPPPPAAPASYPHVQPGQNYFADASYGGGAYESGSQRPGHASHGQIGIGHPQQHEQSQARETYDRSAQGQPTYYPQHQGEQQPQHPPPGHHYPQHAHPSNAQQNNGADHQHHPGPYHQHSSTSYHPPSHYPHALPVHPSQQQQQQYPHHPHDPAAAAAASLHAYHHQQVQRQHAQNMNGNGSPHGGAEGGGRPTSGTRWHRASFPRMEAPEGVERVHRGGGQGGEGVKVEGRS